MSMVLGEDHPRRSEKSLAMATQRIRSLPDALPSFASSRAKAAGKVAAVGWQPFSDASSKSKEYVDIFLEDVRSVLSDCEGMELL